MGRIDKAIQKEQEKLQKMNQEFLETLLELLLKNQKFESGFFELIEKNLDEKKRSSIKKCYEKLKAEYS